MLSILQAEWSTVTPTPLRRGPTAPIRLLGWLWRAGLFLFFVMIIAQLLLPPVTSLALERAIARGMGEPAEVQVRVRSFPAAEVAIGRLDHLSLVVKDGTVGGLPISRLEMQAAGVGIDLPRLLREGRLEFSYGGPGQLKVTLSEADLDWVLKEYPISGLVDPVLRLQEGRAVVTGRVTLLGNELGLKLFGGFRIEGNAVEFVPQNLQVDGYDLGAAVTKKILSSYRLRLPVEFLPAGMNLRDARVTPGVLVITAGTTGTGLK